MVFSFTRLFQSYRPKNQNHNDYHHNLAREKCVTLYKSYKHLENMIDNTADASEILLVLQMRWNQAQFYGGFDDGHKLFWWKLASIFLKLSPQTNWQNKERQTIRRGCQQVLQIINGKNFHNRGFPIKNTKPILEHEGWMHILCLDSTPNTSCQYEDDSLFEYVRMQTEENWPLVHTFTTEKDKYAKQCMFELKKEVLLHDINTQWCMFVSKYPDLFYELTTQQPTPKDSCYDYIAFDDVLYPREYQEKNIFV